MMAFGLRADGGHIRRGNEVGSDRLVDVLDLLRAKVGVR
jgi:hypothetical protein